MLLAFNALASDEKIYRSTCSGHNLAFLVEYADGRINIEEYHAQAKVSAFRFKQAAILSGDFVTWNKKQVRYKGQVYTLMQVSQCYGDFERFYPGAECWTMPGS